MGSCCCGATDEKLNTMEVKSDPKALQKANTFQVEAKLQPKKHQEHQSMIGQSKNRANVNVPPCNTLNYFKTRAVKEVVKTGSQAVANQSVNNVSAAKTSNAVSNIQAGQAANASSVSATAISNDGTFSIMFSNSLTKESINRGSLISLMRKGFHFRESRPVNDLFADSDELRYAAFRKTRLYRDQKLTKTSVSGETVNPKKIKHLMTAAGLEKTRANLTELSPEVRTIIVPPFSNMDLIVPGVYLTGLFAVIEEIINSEGITLIINATNELPLYKSKTVNSYRVPVVDDDQEPIGLYFDDIADLIEVNRRSRNNSVVHCMAGVSRSSTLVLAYLVKYTSFNLHQAFVYTKAVRPCIRPNLGFVRQLIEYEYKLNGRASTKMVEVEDKETNRKATVPDFYPTQCPDLFLIELDRQSKRSKQSNN